MTNFNSSGEYFSSRKFDQDEKLYLSDKVELFLKKSLKENNLDLKTLRIKTTNAIIAGGVTWGIMLNKNYNDDMYSTPLQS